MKLIHKHVLATAVALGFAVSPSMAQIDTTFNANDVLLGFRAASGTGTSTTIMVNLGAASIFRDATANKVNFVNIGSILSTAYDSNWHDRTNLWAGFVSATNGTNVDNSGGVAIASQTTDFNSTIYVSTRRTATGTVGNAQSTKPGNSVALDAQYIGLQATTLGNKFGTESASGVYNGASNVTNLWNTFMTGSITADFDSQYNIEAPFTSGNRGTFGAAGTVEQMWDFYRVAQFPGTDADSGKGLYQGTFTLNSSGEVSFIVVPEPSTYALLALGAGAVLLVARRRNKQNA